MTPIQLGGQLLWMTGRNNLIHPIWGSSFLCSSRAGCCCSNPAFFNSDLYKNERSTDGDQLMLGSQLEIKFHPFFHSFFGRIRDVLAQIVEHLVFRQLKLRCVVRSYFVKVREPFVSSRGKIDI